jgi:hypothetical protein
MPLGARLLSMCALAVAGVQTLRTALFGDMTQPSARLTRYRWPARDAGQEHALGTTRVDRYGRILRPGPI